MSDTDPDLRIAYFQTFLARVEGKMVLADLMDCVYREEYSNGEEAMSVLGRREFVRGILKNCGVTDEAMIEAFALVAAQNQITEPAEEIDLHGD